MKRAILDSHRLLVVTGKGGVGKTALATAMARASAARGLDTVLITLDTREDRHPLLGVPLDYQPREIAPHCWVARVDAFAAITEYARRRMPLAGLYERFFQSRAFRDFAAAAPGFEELMCLGKLYDLVTSGDFDRVVFDAPATGHLKQLFDVPAVTLRAVQVGPLNHNARRIQDLLLDPDRTRVLVTTLAEEMPVREALELLEYCQRTRIPLGGVLVNRRVYSHLSALEHQRLEDLSSAAGAPARLAGVLAQASADWELDALQAAALAPLRGAGARLFEVPRMVQSRFEPAALLDALAGALTPLFGDAR
ncbi:MAG: ArsA family ATPase [Pseudomonadales bacterium]